MLQIILGLIFMAGFGITLGMFFDMYQDIRPRLQALNPVGVKGRAKKKKIRILKQLAFFNKPLSFGPLGKRIAKDLAVARMEMSVEEFLLIKEVAIVLMLVVSIRHVGAEMVNFAVTMSFVFGYMLPEFWLKKKIKRVKGSIIRELPDTIDLLRLCVSAGLDFMLALKWIIEKSRPSILISEMNLVMQEINVGKPRRDALNDLARRYEIPDLSTFSRTLIQADRMGTSVAEALEILSEDMRLARFRRGEAIALKAPMKMLIPVLAFIFPVVAILVAAPVVLDFLSSDGMGSIASTMGN